LVAAVICRAVHQQHCPSTNSKAYPSRDGARGHPQLMPEERSVMTNQTVVLGFAGFLAVCVIGLGFAGQFQPADLHQFDYYMGLTPTASVDCNSHSASTEKPIPAIR
jgi:hypothetical protein